MCSVVRFGLMIAGALLAGLSCFVSEPAIADSGCPNAAFSAGPSVSLPDCRTYEQVSLPGKNGYDILVDHPQGLGGVPPFIEAAPDGSSIDYFSYGATSGSLSHLLESMFLGRREASGWSALPLDLPDFNVTNNGGGTGNRELVAVPTHLDQPVARSDQPLAPGAPTEVGGIGNLFLRRPDGSYALLTPYAPPEAQLGGYTQLEPIGISNDAGQVLFDANATLTPDAPRPGEGAAPLLYDWAGGATTFVGRLEDGTPAFESAALSFGNPISADGSHIFWEGIPTESAPVQVYMRTGGSTIQVSKSQRSTADPNGPQARRVSVGLHRRLACLLPQRAAAHRRRFYGHGRQQRRTL